MMSIRKMAQKILAPVIVVLVIAMAVGLFYVGMPAINKEDFSYKGPAAKVNGETVKDADFNNYLTNAANEASQYAQYGMTMTEAQIRDRALSMAVNDMILQQEIKKAKVKITNSDIAKFIKSRWPTEEEVQSFIQQNNMADKAELNKQVKKFLEYQQFVIKQSKKLKVTVSKAEVEEQMQSVTVKHILIGTKDSSGKDTRTDAEALKIANEVYQKAVVPGTDFGTLAKQYSDDPGSKEQGGAIGPMPLAQFKSQMVKPFVDASLALKKDEISKPVKSDYGYHVIQLIDLGLPTGNTYKDKFAEAEANLYVQKAQDQASEFGKWYSDLTAKAEEKMEILDPGLNAFRLKGSQKWDAAALAYEKALKKSYYKRSAEMFTDAADVYQQLKKPKDALRVLKEVPAEFRDTVTYQIALAKAYKADSQDKEAVKIIDDFSAKSTDSKEHEQLKAVYTEWNLTDKVAKEDQLIAQINKKEQEDLQKYQDELEKKQASPGSQSSPAPASSPSPQK